MMKLVAIALALTLELGAAQFSGQRGQMGGQRGQQAGGQRGQMSGMMTGMRGGQRGQRCNMAEAAASMQQACCTGDDAPDCSDGMPATCTAECAAEYEDFWNACGGTIERALRSQGGQRGQRPGRCPDGDSDDTETCQECFDGVDNDGDGTSDCDDENCQNDPHCRMMGQRQSGMMMGQRQVGGMGGQRQMGGGIGRRSLMRGQTGQAGQRGQHGAPISQPQAQDYLDFFTKCQATDQSNERTDCSVRGVMPIFEACIGTNPTDADFCESHCHHQLVTWASACADDDSQNVMIMMQPYIAGLAQCGTNDGDDGIDREPDSPAARCQAAYQELAPQIMSTCRIQVGSAPASCNHRCADLLTDFAEECPITQLSLDTATASALNSLVDLCDGTKAGVQGNPECWGGDFTFAFCCAGDTGNAQCWDGEDYTYESCCTNGH